MIQVMNLSSGFYYVMKERIENESVTDAFNPGSSDLHGVI